LKRVFEQTPYLYYFQLVADLGSKKCEENKGIDHLLYYSHTDRDMHESESFYQCLYCEMMKGNSKRNQLLGDFVKTTYNPISKIREANTLLNAFISKNPNKEEIEHFVELIVELAL